MRSTMRATNNVPRAAMRPERTRAARSPFPRPARRLVGLVAAAHLVGCAHVPNQFVDDSPSVTTTLDSATAQDVQARFQPARQARRDWPTQTTRPESGAVVHWPLYFEDPFEDKGPDAVNTAGRPPNQRHYIGWEDYVALAYGYPRFWLNTLGMPVSLVVQPPWTAMESDGQLSQQALGYDHDATPLDRSSHDDPPPASAPSDE